jgi:hypothetical protein
MRLPVCVLKGSPSDNTLIVLPADLYVDDSFFEQLRELESSMDQSGAQLALFGKIPLLKHAAM